ncbi:MAG: DUF1499 domain-containing protein [Pseudomonadota bacterium]
MALLDAVFKAPTPQQAASVLELSFSQKPNAALAVPAAMKPAQTFKMTVLEIQNSVTDPAVFLHTVEEALKAAETLTDKADFGENGAVFTVRTPLMRYPDLVYVSLLGAEDEEAASWPALYSHSIYGYSDMGANAKRLRRVLSALG